MQGAWTLRHRTRRSALCEDAVLLVLNMMSVSRVAHVKKMSSCVTLGQVLCRACDAVVLDVHLRRDAAFWFCVLKSCHPFHGQTYHKPVLVGDRAIVGTRGEGSCRRLRHCPD